MNSHFTCKAVKKRASAQRTHCYITPSFPQPVSCRPCSWSAMAFRRRVLSCDLKNKTLWISTRRKGALCKVSVLHSGLRRRNSSRLTRKRRGSCRVTVQNCALRKRQCCRNRSSWRKTLPGQCTELHNQELRFTPTFVLPLSHLLVSAPTSFAWHYTALLSSCDPSPIELSVVLFVVVRVPRMLSWATASKP